MLSTAALIVGMLTCWCYFSSTSEQLLERGLAEAERDPAVAERLLQRAVIAAGEVSPNAQLALCDLMLHRNARADAISSFTTIDCSACRTDLLIKFGRDALRKGLRREGLKALECVASRRSPQSIVALDLLLNEYKEWGQQQKHLETAIAATELDPDKPERWAELIEIQSRLAQESNCVETIHRALQRDFPMEFRKHLRNTLVQQLVNQGDAKAARHELEAWRKLEGDSLRLQGLEVYVCRLEGNLKQSFELVTSIVSQAPTLPFPRFTRGVICLDLHQFEMAIDELEAVVVVQPQNVAAHFKLSEAYRGLGKNDLSAKHQRIAAEISSKQIQITNLLKQREADPFDPLVYQQLEQAHRELRDNEAAKRWHLWSIRVAQLKG